MADSTYPDLRAFLDQLRRDGDLVTVEAPVDARLEAAEIHRRVIAAGGPALLFTNVTGSDFPLATNLFGTARRAEMAPVAPDPPARASGGDAAAAHAGEALGCSRHRQRGALDRLCPPPVRTGLGSRHLGRTSFDLGACAPEDCRAGFPRPGWTRRIPEVAWAGE